MPALADEPAIGKPVRRPWRDLGTRSLSAAVAAPVVLYAFWPGHDYYVILLMLAALALLQEWTAMCGASRLRAPGFALIVSILLALFAMVVQRTGVALAVLAGGTAVTEVLARGTRHGRPVAIGVPYIGCGLIAIGWMRADPAVGFHNVLFLLLLVWGSDIGAYMIGRLVGGPKLAPRISPAKTWSGAVGGLAAAIGAGMLVAWYVAGSLQPLRVAAVAALIGIAAQAGDLLESQIKRRFGVKDSGTLIPGHGGLLDRVDALLIAAPVAALLALAAGRGVVLWQ